MRLRRSCCLAMLLASGCAGGAGGNGAANAAGVLVNIAIAATASGVRRASGDCYTPCVGGTACNPATGYCEPLPCRGLCGPQERCEQTGRAERCVSLHSPSDLQLLQPVRAEPAAQ
jgi:hypothetical protein